MSESLHVIIGLGTTGLSCARYLASQNVAFAVADTRMQPPNLGIFRQNFPEVALSLGQLDENLLSQAQTLIVSPGVSLNEPAIQREILRGVRVIGDVEIFAQQAKAPVIAITGTNAKSTVTSLVGEMAKAAGINVTVGGNLGTPVLDLLSDGTDLYVLELSSFQLETTKSLKPRVATVLNVTPDHLDRYPNFETYTQTKRLIYSNCDVAICNSDDNLTDCGNAFKQKRFNFTLNTPKKNEFGLSLFQGEIYLSFENNHLLPVSELPILGRHYQANALAALAIGHGFGLPFEPMLDALQKFQGLAHRCQLVRTHLGINWYNDSKGTNVGATLAALEGFGSEFPGQLILIAGGVGKNADFSPLATPIEKYVKSVILIGADASIIANVLAGRSEVTYADTMEDAVNIAAKLANAGDSVLLSPACASFDMFKNFEHRGKVFTDCVNQLS